MFVIKSGLQKATRSAGRKSLLSAVIGWAFTLMAGQASAATVTGTIEFQVAFQNVLESSVIVGVDFGSLSPTFQPADGVFDNDPSKGVVFLSSGDFAAAGIGPGSLIDLIDFRFDLSTPGPYAMVGTFDFFMTAIVPSGATSGTAMNDFTGSGFLQDGSGTYDDTLVDWSFNANTNTFAVVGLSSTGNPVPIPAGIWLFASAMGGLLLARRKS